MFDFASLPDFENKAPPLRQFTARDGVSLSFRFYESVENDRIFILLHGSSAEGTYLHALAEFLSARSFGQVYVPNIRGHYASGLEPGDCTYIGQLEDDLFDLIHEFHLENKKIYLVGHSSGGGLAIRMAGGTHGKLIRGYILLAPAIPTAPTMRFGTAGGFAHISFFKIVLLSMLTNIGIPYFNHCHVIRFNKPLEFCDGKETLTYSFNLNSSLHPRLPYQKDILALQDKFLLLVGAGDEAMEPYRYQDIFPMTHPENVKVLEGLGHLELVYHPTALETIGSWIKTKEEE